MLINLEIRNVGIVEEAKIKVDGITVIAGLNGTGKSTISKSLFAAMNSRRDLNKKIDEDKHVELYNCILEWINSGDCSFDEENTTLLKVVCCNIINEMMKNQW